MVIERSWALSEKDAGGISAFFGASLIRGKEEVWEIKSPEFKLGFYRRRTEDVPTCGVFDIKQQKPTFVKSFKLGFIPDEIHPERVIISGEDDREVILYKSGDEIVREF